jgi:micrococcal nuclease
MERVGWWEIRRSEMKRKWLLIPVFIVFIILYFFLFTDFTSVTVTGVIDGDSIIVNHNEKVRLGHIDAPEWNQPYGKEASERVKELALNKGVKIKRSGKDKYGRTLAEIYLEDGRILNQVLVEEGLAWHYRRYCCDRYYQQLEFEARAKRRGLWKDVAPTAPWNWRSGMR